MRTYIKEAVGIVDIDAKGSRVAGLRRTGGSFS